MGGGPGSIACVLVAVLGACGRIGFDDQTLDAASAGDPDGDGVDTAVDNCPAAANPDQDDEDVDGRGDPCDPCPIDSTALGDADTDGDGVGDGCDPRPSQPGDTIAYFTGFARMPSEPLFEGTWTVANGRASVASSLNALAAATVIVAGGSETVMTRATIDQMFGNLVARPVGVAHEMDLPNAEALMCVFGINPSNSQIYAIADNATTSALATAPTPIMVGSTSTFISTRTGMAYRCDADNLASPLTATAPLVSVPNRVGLFARSASASYDYLLVVTAP